MAPKRGRTDKSVTELDKKPVKHLKPAEAQKILDAEGPAENVAESAFASRYLSEPVPKDR